MTSIVIAAHNEAPVIGRCLDSLLADAAQGELDVVVVANGCTDATAEVARSRPGVRVIEVGEASKPSALNAGDEVALGFPRIYLDADIVVSTAGVRTLADALDPVRGTQGLGASAPLAAVPRRELVLRGRPVVVRAYFAVNSRLPVFQDGLFGRGMIGLSREGRDRFELFPDMVADDLFLDSLFVPAEKCQVGSVVTVVETPRRTGDLLRRLVRVRRGNAAMRVAGRVGDVDAQVRRAARLSWLRDVVLPRPWLAPAGLVYVCVSVLAAAAARRHPESTAWARDESTRTHVSEEGSGEGPS